MNLKKILNVIVIIAAAAPTIIDAAKPVVKAIKGKKKTPVVID